MGFVDVKSSAVKVLSIESGDGTPRFSVVGHFDKAKASGLTCVAVGNNIHALNSAVTCEERTDAFVRGPKTEVAYKNILHSLFLLDLTGS
jgi:ethanolamine utilization protein EutA (predicted chaperonin)